MNSDPLVQPQGFSLSFADNHSKFFQADVYSIEENKRWMENCIFYGRVRVLYNANLNSVGI